MKNTDTIQLSKKAFQQAVMPMIGDVIEGCRVFYVKKGSLSYNASGARLPVEEEQIEWNGRKFTVSRVDTVKKQYTAIFSGFKDFTVPEPVNDNVEKLI